MTKAIRGSAYVSNILVNIEYRKISPILVEI